jgi:hypothetical protein
MRSDCEWIVLRKSESAVSVRVESLASELQRPPVPHHGSNNLLWSTAGHPRHAQRVTADGERSRRSLHGLRCCGSARRDDRTHQSHGWSGHVCTRRERSVAQSPGRPYADRYPAVGWVQAPRWVHAAQSCAQQICCAACTRSQVEVLSKDLFNCSGGLSYRFSHLLSHGYGALRSIYRGELARRHGQFDGCRQLVLLAANACLTQRGTR